MGPKILITGATGNNGRELIRQLSNAGIKVRAMVHSLDKAESVEFPGVEIVEGDFENITSMEKAFSGMEKAFIAMSVNPKHVEWAKNFVDVATKSDVKHIVKLSLMGADANADSLLIRLHGQSDQYIFNSGLTYTILRPNSFHQNIFGSLETIKNQGVFYYPFGDIKLSTIDIRDIASVGLKVLTEAGHEYKVYTLTGPEALSFYQVAEKISKIIGKEIKYIPVSFEDSKNAMIQAGMSNWLASNLVELFQYFTKGGYDQVTRQVGEITGNQPIRFDQFIHDNKKIFFPAGKAI